MSEPETNKVFCPPRSVAAANMVNPAPPGTNPDAHDSPRPTMPEPSIISPPTTATQPRIRRECHGSSAASKATTPSATTRTDPTPNIQVALADLTCRPPRSSSAEKLCTTCFIHSSGVYVDPAPPNAIPTSPPTAAPLGPNLAPLAAPTIAGRDRHFMLNRILGGGSASPCPDTVRAAERTIGRGSLRPVALPSGYFLR